MDKKITELDFITHLDLSINDLFELIDVSEEVDNLRNKQLALGELLTYLRKNSSYTNPFRVVTTPPAGETVINIVLPLALSSDVIDNNKIYFYRNGVLQNPGIGSDYTVSTCCLNSQLTFTLFIPTGVNDVFQTVYWP